MRQAIRGLATAMMWLAVLVLSLVVVAAFFGLAAVVFESLTGIPMAEQLTGTPNAEVVPGFIGAIVLSGLAIGANVLGIVALNKKNN